MSNSITFDGRKYISANDAGSEGGLSRDYVARLCRDGKLRGKRIGKNWYVEENSLKAFLVTKEYERASRSEALSNTRAREYVEANLSSAPTTPSQSALQSPPARKLSTPTRAASPIKEQLLGALTARSSYAAESASHLAKAPAGVSLAGLQHVHVPVHMVTPVTELVHKLVALTLTFALVFGTYAAVDPQYARFALNSIGESISSAARAASHVDRAAESAQAGLAYVAEHPSLAFSELARSFPRAASSLARALNSRVNAFVYAVAFPAALVGSRAVAGITSRGEVSVEVQPYARPIAPLASTKPVGGSGSSAPTTLQGSVGSLPSTSIRTIEKVTVERIVTSGGLTEEYLNERLQQLDNKISSALYTAVSRASTPPASGGVVNNIALTQKIDRLNGVDITGGTITGATISGGSVTATSYSGILGVGNGGTGISTAPTYGKLLVGNSDGGYDLVATSSLGITGSGASADDPFSHTTNFATSVSATSSIVWFQGGLQASSTSQIAYASSTALTLSGLGYFNGGFLALASSTIGDGSATGGLTVSGTATSTNLIVSSAGGTAGCATFSTTGLLSNTGVACGTGSGNDPFTHTAYLGQTTSATSTLIRLTGSPFSLAASSTSLFDNATTTFATISNTLWLPALTSSGLGVDANGKVYAAATSTLSNISGSLPLTSLAAQAANTVIANGTGASAVPTAVSTSSLFAASNGQVLARVNGTWTGVATTTFSTGLTYASGAVVCDTASGSVLGCLSSADWTTFNNKLSSYDAWTHTTNFAQNVAATTSVVWFQNGLHASSTSQIAYASTTAITATTASTTNLRVSNSTVFENLASGGLAVTSAGSLYAYSTSTWSFASSTLLADSNTWTGGNLFLASTTIGAGGQTTGLTVSGGATTTGNQYIGGRFSIGSAPGAASITISPTSGATRILQYTDDVGAQEYISAANRNFTFGTNRSFTFQTELDTNLGSTYNFGLSNGIELTAASGEQAFFSLDNRVEQSGTAGYVGLLFNVSAVTGRGSGQSYLTDFRLLGNSKFNVTEFGNVGISTSSPYALLSVVAASTTGSLAPKVLFEIASTTGGTATTTLFSISNTGIASTTNLRVSNSTVFENLASGGLAVTSAGSLYAYSTSTWSFASSTLLADSNTWTGGNLFLASTTIGAGGQATGLTISGGATTTGRSIANGGFFSPLGLAAGFSSISLPIIPGAGQIFGTGFMGVVDTSANFLSAMSSNMIETNSAGRIGFGPATTVDLFTLDAAFSRLSAGVIGVGTGAVGSANGTLALERIGLGTSTPYAQLSILATSTNGLGSPTTLFAIASTTGGTATSTLFSISNTGIASTTYLYGAGLPGTGCSGSNFLQWTAGSFGCAVSTGGLSSYDAWTHAVAGGTSATTSAIGVGTTTPWAQFAISTSSASSPTTQLFAISSSTSAAILNVLGSGNIGVGTTSPWAQLSINPDGISGPAFAIGSTTKTDFLVTNGGNVGVGTTSPYAQFSIFSGADYLSHPASTLFAIGSSSAGTATSTLFSVDNTGQTSIGQFTSGTVGYRFSSAAGSLGFYSSGSNVGGILWSGPFQIINAQSGNDVYLETSSVSGPTHIQSRPGGTVQFDVSQTGYSSFGSSRDVGLSRYAANKLALGTSSLDFSGTLITTNLGLGTSTPYAQLSILATSTNGLGSPTTLFAIASTTGGTATSTLFSISNTGIASTTYLYGAGLPGTGCSGSNFLQWTAGSFGCAAGGGGGAFAWTPTTNFGVAANSTTTSIWFRGTTYSLFASSTSVFDSATSTYFESKNNTFLASAGGAVGVGTTTPQWLLNPFSSSAAQLALSAGAGFGQWAFRNAGGNFYLATTTVVGTATTTTTALTIVGSSGNVGISTSSPYAKLSVHANAGETNQTLFAIGSSTSATTTTILSVSNGGLFSIGSNLFTSDAITGSTTIANLSIGNITFDTNAGVVNLSNLPVDSNAANGVYESQSIAIGDTPLITAYGQSDGAGGVKNLGVGIGTSTPWGKLVVWGDNQVAASSTLIVTDSASTTLFTVKNSGVVGIGTSTPWAMLSINPDGISGPAFAIGSSSATYFQVTNAGSVGIGTTSPGSIFSIQSIANFQSGTSTIYDNLNVQGQLKIGTGSIFLNGAATSTFSAGIQTPSINITNQSATSTFANGIQLTGGCFLTTSGTCLSSSGGLSSYDAWTHVAGNQSATTSAIGVGTTTPWAQLSVSTSTASSPTTPLFVVASSTNATLFGVFGSGNVGIGTTSPSVLFSVLAGADYQSHPASSIFTVGSSTAGTATSTLFNVDNNGNATIKGTLTIQGGGTTPFYSLMIPSNTLIGPSGTGQGINFIQNSGLLVNQNGNYTAGIVYEGIGNISMYVNSGSSFSWSSASTISSNDGGVDTSLTRQAAGVVQISKGTTANALGSLIAARVGIGTTTIPHTLLAITATSTTGLGSPLTLFEIASTTGGTATTTLFSITNTGAVFATNLTNDVADAKTLCLTSANEVVANSGTTCITSSLRFKDNIASLDSASGLGELLKFNPVSFTYKEGIGVAGEQVGFIAEEMQQVDPRLVVLDASSTPFSVKYENLTAILTKAVQEIATISGAFKDALVAWFADAANGISDFFANRVHTKELCVGENGSETCVTKTQLDALLVGAAAPSSPPPSDPSPSSPPPEPEPEGDTEPPVITLLGNNPATINVGDSYADLGATVTDNVNDNLGIEASLDDSDTWSEIGSLQLDTSTAGEHTIHFRATDQAGNTGTTERAVNVVEASSGTPLPQAPAPADQPPADPSPTP